MARVPALIDIIARHGGHLHIGDAAPAGGTALLQP